MVLKLWHFLSNMALDWLPVFHLLIFMIISFQTCTCKWHEKVRHRVIKIICSADRGLITLKHTCILYFKGVEWFLILNTFLCCMPCLCTSPCEPIHSWQSWDSVFFHCARCSPQTLSIWSQVCRACWDPANQNITSTKQSTASQNIHALKQLLGCNTRRPRITFSISITSLIPPSHIHTFTRGKTVTSMV